MRECEDRIEIDKSMDELTDSELMTLWSLVEMVLPCSVCEGDLKRLEKEIARRGSSVPQRRK